MTHHSESESVSPMKDEHQRSVDEVKHGIEPVQGDDVAVGAEIGGVGGAITGAIAGAGFGIPGAITGAVIGGVLGAAGSAAAVAAVDKFDSDNPELNQPIPPSERDHERHSIGAVHAAIAAEDAARKDREYPERRTSPPLEENDEDYGLTVDGRDHNEIPIPIVPEPTIPGPSAAGMPGVLPDRPLKPLYDTDQDVELPPEPNLAEDGTPNGVPYDTVDHVRKSPMK